MEKKDKIQLGITGVLVIILLLFLARAFEKKKRPLPVKAKEVAADQKVKEPDLYTRLEQEIKKMDFKRDPFSRQSLSDLEESQDLHLSGILWDEVNPTAIINDEIVAVGSRIQGGRVVDIRKDKVILEEGDYHIELVLE
ncbi:MAG TPA: hypothetical protein DE315_00390 [Candidatus Omnitrophica bacterium]|nr:hypothetical protein [Candidatus Omnitrophota bacterium]HCI43980.1 hypothetical protein [Candidatus Omnitrophota bacterium]